MEQKKNTQSLKWLFLDLNSYFASVEQQERPELRGKPIAIVPIMTDSTCAIAASYEAKAYGVKTGTMIYEAKKRCPSLICVEARHSVYVDYHHRIFEELERHVHIDKVCSIDEVACRLMKNEQSISYITNLVGRIKEGMRSNVGPAIGFSIGVAPNRFLAKTASNMQKPNGFTILNEDNLPERLFKLKLKDLTGINVNMEQRLHSAEIYSVEQFYNLSPKHARSIWGSVNGEKFWYELHGMDMPEQETQKRVVGHSRVLEPSSRYPSQAYTITRRLTTKAATRLRSYELFSSELLLKVRFVDGDRWKRSRRFEPAQDNFSFLRVLYDLWSLMLAETNNGLILQVAVTLCNLKEGEDITLDLFSNSNRAASKDEALSLAVDQINDRYGSSLLQFEAIGKDKAETKIAFTRIPDKSEFRQ